MKIESPPSPVSEIFSWREIYARVITLFRTPVATSHSFPPLSCVTSLGVEPCAGLERNKWQPHMEQK
jgi:hypothetical protein